MEYKNMTPEQKKKVYEKNQQWRKNNPEKVKGYYESYRKPKINGQYQDRNYMLYTIWNNKTDELICFELPAKEACVKMKMTLGNFLSVVSRSITGEYKKYKVLKTRQNITVFEQTKNMNIEELAMLIEDMIYEHPDADYEEIVELLKQPYSQP